MRVKKYRTITEQRKGTLPLRLLVRDASLLLGLILLTTFNASGAAPTVSSINPPSGARGSTVSVTITGTSFLAGATTVYLVGMGPTAGYSLVLGSINVSSASSLTGVVAIPAAFPLGPYYVSLGTPGGSSLPVGFNGCPNLLNCPVSFFNITTAGPVVTSFFPSYAINGATVSLTVTGSGFVAGSTTASLTGTDIYPSTSRTVGYSVSVSNVSVTSSTSLTGTLTIPGFLPPGFYLVTVTTPSGMGSSSIPFEFVQASITSISPPSGTAGSTVPVSIAGHGFVAGATTASLNGTGATAGFSMSISNVNVISDTSLTGVVTIPASIAPGSYVVWVTPPTGTIRGPAIFVVNPVLTVSSISPSSGAQGSTLSVTVAGTGFIAGSTAVSLTGSGSTTGYSMALSNVNVTSSTSLTGVVTIPAFPLGTYYVTVSTLGGKLTTAVTFTVTAPATTGGGKPFQLADHGSLSTITSGSLQTPVVGYAAITPNSGSSAPSGLAIFGFRQNNTLVTEAALPATPPLLSGRIYAEVNTSINTGLAIANPNNQPANLSFYFTDSSGNSGNGTTTIAANAQMAAFLNQAPFNSQPVFSGAFTFTSSVPIAVVALRGLTNERSEFLITTLPVADLSAGPSTSAPVFPHFADGGGWTTQIVLVNPTDAVLAGTVEFRDPAGQNSTLSVNGQVNNSFSYAIPGRSSQKLQTAGSGSSITAGSVRVNPNPGTVAPSGLAVFSFNNAGITVSEAGVPAVSPGTAFRLFAEASGDFSHGSAGSLQTGIAVTNSSDAPATVTLELFKQDGSSTGLTGTLSVPPLGQTATFLNQVQGFASLQTPFQGVWRISNTASISVVGLRGRYNERGDFLITTIPSTNEASPAPTGPVYFPHLVDGGGYTTQFILFTGQAGQSSSGMLQLFGQSGAALNLQTTSTGNGPSPQITSLSAPSACSSRIRAHAAIGVWYNPRQCVPGEF